MPDLQPYLSAILIGLGILLLVIILIVIYKLLNQRVRGRKGQRRIAAAAQLDADLRVGRMQDQHQPPGP